MCGCFCRWRLSCVPRSLWRAILSSIRMRLCSIWSPPIPLSSAMASTIGSIIMAPALGCFRVSSPACCGSVSCWGWNQPAHYVAAVKTSFCLLSVIIPYSMYVVGRNLFGETSGRVGLVLGAFWYELVGFAHKPMTEFTATILIFLLLALVVRPPARSLSRPVIAVGVGVLRRRRPFSLFAGGGPGFARRVSPC